MLNLLIPSIKKNKYNILQFLIISLIISAIFYNFIFAGKTFLLTIDQQHLYNPLYEEWLRLVKRFLLYGEYPFYSWFKFLGSDFYTSSSIFVTGDIFLPFLLLFKNIDNALLFETIALIYISSFTFSYFLKEWSIQNKRVILLTSIFYAFSGFALLFFTNYMFHRFYAFMPLAFAGIQKILNKKSPHLFIISIFILTLTSLYFMFPLTLYFVIWYVFAYLFKYHEFEWKSFFYLAFKLIGYYLIGFLMSAFLSIPTILYLIQSSRIGVNYDHSLFWNIKVWTGFIYSHMIAPYSIVPTIPNMFYYGTNGHETWYSVYTSLISIPVILTYLIKIKDSKKKYFTFLISAFLITLLIRPLSSIFHGFSVSTLRISFIYNFILLISVAYILNKFENIKWTYGLIIYLIIFSITTVVLIMNDIFIYEDYSQSINFAILSLFLSILLTIFYPKSLNNYYLVISFIITGFISYQVLKPLEDLFYEYTPSITKEYINYYQSIDEDNFYRMYINPEHLLPTSTMNLNQSLLLNFHSVMTYDTGYEPNLSQFNQLNNYNWHLININKPSVLKMLGVKYYIVYSEEELPNNYSFEYMYELNFLKVYKLIDYRPLGFTYTNFVDIDSVDKSWDSWNEIALIENDDFSLIENINISESVNLTNIEIFSYGVNGQIDLSQKELLFLSIPYNSGWTIYDNDEKIEAIKVNGGFIGLVLDEGQHELKLRFLPYGLKEGLVLTLLGFISYGVLIISLRRFKHIHNSK